MARKSLDDNILDGMLTVNNVAELTGISGPVVRKWCNNELIKHAVLMPGSKEWRIPALHMVVFLTTQNFRITDKLKEAAKNYAKNYNATGQLKVLLGAGASTED